MEPETEHYFVIVDRAHVRVYAQDIQPGQSKLAYRLVEAIDLPEGKKAYTSRDTDQAGRFPGPRGREPGMSIDERLPMKEEKERRVTAELAGLINRFFYQHPRSTWDLAAPMPILRTLTHKIAPEPKQRLRRSIGKDLANQPADDLPAIGTGGPRRVQAWARRA